MAMWEHEKSSLTHKMKGVWKKVKKKQNCHHFKSNDLENDGVQPDEIEEFR